jgi:hypothetical protein
MVKQLKYGQRNVTRCLFEMQHFIQYDDVQYIRTLCGIYV